MKISFGRHHIDIQKNPNGSSRLTSTLKDTEAAEDGDDDAIDYNLAIDGLESLVLAQASAGIDVTAPAYVKALEVAVEAIYQNTAG